MAVECNESGMYVSKILSDRRKAKKPLMEKMRRARINDSLNELKGLILDLLNKDASRYSKMEKADILEMTVNYLKLAQKKDRRTQEPTSVTDYRAGYNQCLSEVTRTLPGSEYIVREKLLTHLASSFHGNSVPEPVTRLTVPATSAATATSTFPAVPSTTMWVPYPSPPPSPTKETQTPVYLSSCIPVQADVSRPPTPVSPCLYMTQKQTAQTSPVAKKPELWRPW